MLDNPTVPPHPDAQSPGETKDWNLDPSSWRVEYWAALHAVSNRLSGRYKQSGLSEADFAHLFLWWLSWGRQLDPVMWRHLREGASHLHKSGAWPATEGRIGQPPLRTGSLRALETAFEGAVNAWVSLALYCDKLTTRLTLAAHSWIIPGLGDPTSAFHLFGPEAAPPLADIHSSQYDPSRVDPYNRLSDHKALVPVARAH